MLDLACVACLLTSCISGRGPNASRTALIDEDLTVASRGSESVGYYNYWYAPIGPTWWAYAPAEAEAAAEADAQADGEATVLAETATRVEWRAEIDDRLRVIDARIKAVNASVTPEQRIRLEEARNEVESGRLEVATLADDKAFQVMLNIDDNLAVLETELDRAEGIGTSAERLCRVDPELPLGRVDRDLQC